MKTDCTSFPKIVVIGSCSVDFTTYAPRLPNPGETLHGHKFTTSFGGKGANQCVAAAKLGGNCSMICRVGDDQWGAQYKDHFKEVGVDVSYVHITPNVTTGIAQISVAENGENQIIIVPGANNLLSKSDVKDSAELIKSADVLISQLETPFETTLEAFKLNNGIKILNAAPAPAKANIHELLPHCTILCVNESEASLITDLNVDLMNAKEALYKLLGTGCQTVIITLGDKGAVLLDSNKYDKQPIHIRCEKVKPIDTTGAGDAFVGALATYLITHSHLPLHKIVGAACSVASLSVTKEGTQTSYPTKSYNPFTSDYEYNNL